MGKYCPNKRHCNRFGDLRGEGDKNLNGRVNRKVKVWDFRWRDKHSFQISLPNYVPPRGHVSLPSEDTAPLCSRAVHEDDCATELDYTHIYEGQFGLR